MNDREYNDRERQKQDMLPIWESRQIYREPLLFVQDSQTGLVRPGRLLFVPDEVTEVTSSDLTVHYREEEDYRLEGNQIVRTARSRIPFWTEDECHPAGPTSIAIESVWAPGRYVRYEPGAVYHRAQTAVTYRHHERWEGIRPSSQLERLPRTAGLLRKREELRIVYYGDSIVEGCDSSGMHGALPGVPIFSKLASDELAAYYRHTRIQTWNTAMGGEWSQWGLEQIDRRVTAHRPDLVVIGFGNNDSGYDLSPSGYEVNIRRMIEKVRQEKAEAEFLLLSVPLPNPDCRGWTKWQLPYRRVLQKIAADTCGVAVAPIGEMQDFLLSRKPYLDLCGNGVNHPNDFLARVYGQTVAACLKEEV